MEQGMWSAINTELEMFVTNI